MSKFSTAVAGFYGTKLGKFLMRTILVLSIPAFLIYSLSSWLTIKVAFELPMVQYSVLLLQSLLFGALWFSALFFVRGPTPSRFKRTFLLGIILVVGAGLLQNFMMVRFVNNPERFGEVLDSYLK
jgi:hypothetical protein